MGNILEIEHLQKTYMDFQLQDVSFHIPYGTIMGFIGENGAGKTTTMKAILDMIEIEHGSIRIFGKNYKDDGKQLRQDIGVVLTESSFPEYMTPKQIASVLRHMYNHWDDRLYETYIKNFQLPMQKPIKELSKGMRMKLNIVMALSHHPKLLLLDEATSGLDPIVREEILDMFQDFIQDESHAVLLSSHITSDIEKVADYITFIHNGKIILSDEKDVLLDHYGILKTNEATFKTLSRNDMVSYRKNKYSIEVLIKDKVHMQNRYANAAIDRASLEDIMLYTVKGETL